jgi:hypothetical protein
VDRKDWRGVMLTRGIRGCDGRSRVVGGIRGKHRLFKRWSVDVMFGCFVVVRTKVGS